MERDFAWERSYLTASHPSSIVLLQSTPHIAYSSLQFMSSNSTNCSSCPAQSTSQDEGSVGTDVEWQACSLDSDNFEDDYEEAYGTVSVYQVASKISHYI